MLASLAPCECCLEINWNAPEVFKKVFLSDVVKSETAMVVWRIPHEGRKNYRYHGRNFRVACCYECAKEYEAYWQSHPRRRELIGIIESGTMD